MTAYSVKTVFVMVLSGRRRHWKLLDLSAVVQCRGSKFLATANSRKE